MEADQVQTNDTYEALLGFILNGLCANPAVIDFELLSRGERFDVIVKAANEIAINALTVTQKEHCKHCRPGRKKERLVKWP